LSRIAGDLFQPSYDFSGARHRTIVTQLVTTDVRGNGSGDTLAPSRELRRPAESERTVYGFADWTRTLIVTLRDLPPMEWQATKENIYQQSGNRRTYLQTDLEPQAALEKIRGCAVCRGQLQSQQSLQSPDYGTRQ